MQIRASAYALTTSTPNWFEGGLQIINRNVESAWKTWLVFGKAIRNLSVYMKGFK